MNDARYCKDCKNINCPEGRVNCKYPDAIACELYRDAPLTLFDRITQSPESLAEKLVVEYQRGVKDYAYYSTVTGGLYNTKAEAIAATVEKLKEVYNE